MTPSQPRLVRSDRSVSRAARPRPQACLLVLLTALLSGLFGCSEDPPGEGASPAAVWPGGSLVGVAVTSDEQVLVASRNGEIHRSLDTGRSWQRSRSPAVESLAALSMADEQVGWAVGPGVILRSEDGGRLWQRQRLPGRSEDFGLLDVAAIDRERAVAVGRAGLRLYTEDGGATWQHARRPSAEIRPAAIRSVACRASPTPRCGAVGLGLEASDDGGASWRTLQVGHDLSPPRIPLADGQVEIDDPQAAHLRRVAESLRARSALRWQIDVHASALEVEASAWQDDPVALFELLEARAQEARSLLEDAGIATDAIRVVAEPPWNYEDFSDDDPGFLARYLAERSAAQASLVVRIVEGAPLRAIALAPGDAASGPLREHSLPWSSVAGEAGAWLRSDAAGAVWTAGERISPHDLHAVGIGAERIVLAGAQDGFWQAAFGTAAWQAVVEPERPGSFDAWWDIAFSPSGRTGVAVGEAGRIRRSLDGGVRWQSLSGPHSERANSPDSGRHTTTRPVAVDRAAQEGHIAHR